MRRTNNSTAIKRYLIGNFRFGIIGGVLGVVVFLILSPIQEKNSKKYVYSIYKFENGYPEKTFYVKSRTNLNLLYMKNTKGIAYYGMDLFVLPENNQVWVLDTIGSDIIKFKARYFDRHNRERNKRGYALVKNLHSNN